MKRKKFIYRRISLKAQRFAKREHAYTYEYEPLEKGYYHGYVDGAKALASAIRKGTIVLGTKTLTDNKLMEILGKPKTLLI